MEQFFTFLRDVGFFGFIVWGVQKIINNSSDRKFADYKSQINLQLMSYKNQYDNQIEQYKSELKFLNDKLASLYGEHLKIVKELYQKLVRLDSAMRTMTRTMIPIINDAEAEEKARIAEAQEAFADFNNFVLFNKIYFTKPLAEKLEWITTEYWSAQWDFFEPKRLQSMGVKSREIHIESYEKLKAASLKV